MATYTCCTGQTECNHIITIGYLKSFIGTDIENTGGTTVYVNTSQPDSYVPTYSELTGGTLLPQFVDGGSGKWHSSVDGITVKGTYASNQNVKQEDLILTYTRFKSLSLSAGKTSLSECAGDSTSICATYTLTKTVKQMNSSCTVTSSKQDGSDTTCKMSFSRGCNWLTLGSCLNNCITVTTQKNGSWTANSRTCVVTATVTYKGASHSSNVTLTQRALTGGYYVRNYKERTYDSIAITSHDNQYYGCEGGNFSITATGYYTDLYMWEDSCGTVYDQTPYSGVGGSEIAGYDSGSFEEITCPTEHEDNQTTLSVSYHGHVASMTFYQACEQDCPECANETACTRNCSATGEADVCGGNVTVSCTRVCDVDVYDWVSGVCTYISSTTEDRDVSAVISIQPNTTEDPQTYSGTKNGIDYVITQPAGPCGGCSGETHSIIWSTPSPISCEGGENIRLNVSYSAVTSYTNCSPIVVTRTSAFTFNLDCNSGGTKVLREANPRIVQAGGCDCSCKNPTSTTVYYNASGTAEACEESKTVKVPYLTTIKYSNCDDDHYSGEVDYTAIFSKNNTSSVRTHTYNYSGATVTIVQAAGPCSCLDESHRTEWGEVTIPCSGAASLQVSVPYSAITEYSNCPPIITPSHSAVTLYNIECNSGSSHVIAIDPPVPFKVIQEGGCDCSGPCQCNINSDTAQVNFEYISGGTADKTVPFTADTCLSISASVTTEVTGLQLAVASTTNSSVVVRLTNTSYEKPFIDTKIGTLKVQATNGTETCSIPDIPIYIEGECRMFTLNHGSVDCSGSGVTFTFT